MLFFAYFPFLFLCFFLYLISLSAPPRIAISLCYQAAPLIKLVDRLRLALIWCSFWINASLLLSPPQRRRSRKAQKKDLKKITKARRRRPIKGTGTSKGLNAKRNHWKTTRNSRWSPLIAGSGIIFLFCSALHSGLRSCVVLSLSGRSQSLLINF